MDVLTITFVTATTAFVSAVTGPVVSYLVARRQIRASVVSNNRERWIEALRDAVAEYVALLLTAGLLRQTIGQDPAKAMNANHDLLEIIQRIILVKNKIMLMTNPSDDPYMKLCQIVESTYRELTSGESGVYGRMHAGAESITKAGREVLKAEWARVKRGE